MLNIESWLPLWSRAVLERFGGRVLFLGLQGSRARGEAREDSDIDTVLVLDRLEASDLAALREALAPLPERGKLCGFVSGRAELLAWEPGELFQFYHDTRPVLGSLDFLLPLLTREAALSSVRTGAGAVYHGCAHYLLHGGAPEELEALQKHIHDRIKAILGIEITVSLAEPKSIERFTGKAKRIVDLRGQE